MSEYAALWVRGQHRANTLALEPDQARERGLKLLRYGHPFVMEIDPTLPGMKDVVAVSTGASWQEREGYSYIRKRALAYDDAAQYLVNLIRAELSFSVTPEFQPNSEVREWLFQVEMRNC